MADHIAIEGKELESNKSLKKVFGSIAITLTIALTTIRYTIGANWPPLSNGDWVKELLVTISASFILSAIISGISIILFFIVQLLWNIARGK